MAEKKLSTIKLWKNSCYKMLHNQPNVYMYLIK